MGTLHILMYVSSSKVVFSVFIPQRPCTLGGTSLVRSNATIFCVYFTFANFVSTYAVNKRLQ